MGNIELIKTLAANVQQHYLSQFLDFIEKQKRLCKVGSAEVKFSLTGETNAFHHLAVVDFVRSDGGVEGIQFEPENTLSFEAIDGQIGNSKLVIAGLRWDGVVILHDVKNVENAISDWFVSWFDPEETGRFNGAGEISECIHAVYVEPSELQVDFGTASPVAFWELLECLAGAGATQIHVSA